MPTKPIQDFIPREIENIKLSRILNEFSEAIEETVNFGSHVFKWCFNAATGRDENIPIFLSFRHVFELADSVSMLMKQSCIEPCKILLRAIFESLLTIEYILEKDTKRRAMDFMVWHTHQELKICRRWHSDDPLCKEFKGKIKADKVLKNMEITEFPQIKDEIDKRKKTLQLPRYSESEKEYQRLKKERKKEPRWWFSLHNGPENIEKLAKKLNRPAQYHVLYRQWSSAAHGIDIIRSKVSVDESGRVLIHQIRLPNDAQFVTLLTMSFASIVIRKFIDHFVPAKKSEAQKWYVDEIRDINLALSKKKFIEII